MNITFFPRHKSLVFLAILFSSVGCEASCWPDLVEQNAGVHLAFDRRFYDSSRAHIERQELREELRKCPEDTSFFYTLPAKHVASGTYSILDMAIATDDAELTRQYLKQFLGNGSPISDELVYGGEYVALAAFLESERALEVLLEFGMSASEPSGIGSNGPLFSAQVYTESGLGVIRRLVDEGANVNVQNDKGRTAIEIAAWRGNLMMVQCLFALGASLPPPTSTDDVSFRRSVDAIAETNAFIDSVDRALSPQVSEICRSGQQ